MFKSFINPAVSVAKTIDHTADIIKGLQALEKLDVLVGIPQEDATRKDPDGPNNAELAYLLTKGCPLRHIPPRPFLQPAIEKNADKLAKWQKQAIQDALAGKMEAVRADAEKLGMAAQIEIKRFIKDKDGNGLAPNHPATIEKKGSDTPLIDTGALWNAIHYVLRQQ